MKKLTDYKLLLWDFDGVLMDSMPVRNDGFRFVLQDYPKEQVEELMQYHLANGGLSRYVKFRYFFEQIRGEAIDAARINEFAHSFSEMMLERLINKDLLIADSLDFVLKYHKVIPMHIVSGSDERELNMICNQLGLNTYFQSIHGSPVAKQELVQRVLAFYPSIKKEDILFIGDSINDYEAAKKNRIPFAAYNNLFLKESGFDYIESFQS